MFLESQNIFKNLETLESMIRHDVFHPVSIRMKEGHFKSQEEADRAPSPWIPFENGGVWGKEQGRYWFDIELEAPESMDGKCLCMYVTTGRDNLWDPINPQFIVFVNGELRHALDVNHRLIILSKNAEAGKRYRIGLDAYFGRQNAGFDKWTMSAYLKIECSPYELEIERLYYNLYVPHNITDKLDKDDYRYVGIIRHLIQALKLLDLRKPYSKSFFESVDKTNQYLEKEFYDGWCKRNLPADGPVAHSIGHAHIDIAWGWTVKESRDKAVRTFSNVLDLMDDYEHVKFMQSQPVLYQFIKEDFPQVYKKVKEKIKEGRWEADGSLWVEADCNLTSGESLVRQIMYGKQFYREEFGQECKILWLPDVFGYSAALPQILRKAGLKYFMTTKLASNEYNNLPYDLFMWQGIDGSDILSYLPKCYNGLIEPWHLQNEWQTLRQKTISSTTLIPYGFGDGGGGPTRRFAECAIRLEKGVPGCPVFKSGKAKEFFVNTEKNVTGEIPRWVGELYFENHRGTYTSLGRIKRKNRKSELRYEQAELLCVLSGLVSGRDMYEEYKKLIPGWEKILINQFHDILPGSSIKEVYDDADQYYEEAFEIADRVIDDAVNSLVKDSSDSFVVFNDLDFDRDDLVELDVDQEYEVDDEMGNRLPSQLVYDEVGPDPCRLSANLKGRRLLVYAKSIPSKGYSTIRLKPTTGKAPALEMMVCAEFMENKFFKVEFDEEMYITRIYDKLNNREVLAPGARANLLHAFEDRPMEFPSWNTDLSYQRKEWTLGKPSKVQIVETGPVRAAIRVTRTMHDTVIIQDIQIYKDIPRIDFDTWIDWRHQEVLLKTAFPVNIHANEATYDIQFGNLTRPTHWNTSWDISRFEVCGQKWADLSQDDYGVSILNDCKYGHDIFGNVMRLTLIKSSGGWPFIEADNETHRFKYSIYPHKEGWKNGMTAREGYKFNCPLKAVRGDANKFSLIKKDLANVIIETVKPSEDGSGIILRAYEAHNRRSKVNLTFFKEPKEVREVAITEDSASSESIKIDNKDICLEFKPYEIKTIKIDF